MTPSRSRDGARRPSPAAWAGLFGAYAIAGKLGLKLAFVHASATAVWPPTGIALAAFLLLGPRTWPAILAGAFLVNVTTAGSFLTSLGIAVGNTLEGLCGAWLVKRFAGGPRAFERPADVFRFAALAGLLSTTVSATLGVTSLSLGGFASWGDYPAIWQTWWLGDLGGALVVAPLLILWGVDPRPRWGARRTVELSLLAVVLVLTGLALFGGLLPAGHRVAFLAVPPVLWAAFRFCPREAATATALLSAIAIWGALHASGPFVTESPNQSLVLLQAFMGVMSVTTLAVAAGVAQRRRAEEALSRSAAIVDSSRDAIVGKGLDGTIVSWNQGAERLYGYSAAEAVGRNVSILSPRDRPDEITGILERVRRGGSIEPYETVRVRKDGRKVMIALTVSPIRDAGGRVVGASAIGRDITQRRRAEERLATQSAVTRVLAESTALRDAAPCLLEAVCKGLGWDVGELWRPEAEPGRLRCETTWPSPTDRADDTLPASPPTSVLAARVFASGQPLWIGDPSGEPGRLLPAADHHEGLREAMAVPVPAEGRRVGVLVFYRREPQRARQGLLETVGDIASRLGQFMERERALVGLRRLEKAVETIEMGVTMTDMAGRILYTNRAEAELHGYTVEELIGKPVSVFMPAAWRPAAGRPPEVRSWRRETVNLRRDGTIFPVQLLSDAVTDIDGTPLGIVTCCEEITERKRTEQALRSSESRYRLLFERNLAGVYRATLGGRLLECNDAFARVLGHSSQDEVLSRTARDLFFRPDDRERSLAVLREKGTLTNFELQMRRKDGSSVWVLENETLLKGQNGEEDIVEGTLIDITDRKLAAERAEFHAYHDPLTGLPNRMHLRDRMHLALAQARRSGRGLALMFLDLDQFKVVNDTLGHSVGDRLLQEVAGRLKECLREDDTVARVGGDEFVLLLPSVRHAEGAARIARKLLDRIEDVFQADGHELSVTTSVGIALFPQHGADEEALLKSADAAMYRAKDLGRNGYQFCDAATGRQVHDHMALQDRLGQALERGEISLAYQPQVELRSDRVVGVEALLRWHDPQRGPISPTEFVPLAEDTGLIVRLGEWSLEQACRQARAWQGEGLPALRVAVNVSVRQLWQSDLKSSIKRILGQTALDPGRLDLEITETTAMQNFDLTVPILRDLAEMGIRLTIDDFGTGYSSLSHLKLLPVQRLKIDRSLIAGIAREPRDLAIVETVVKLAHSLGFAVVAEGVETEEQRTALRALRCDEMQGWIFSDAIPAQSVPRLLTAPRH